MLHGCQHKKDGQVDSDGSIKEVLAKEVGHMSNDVSQGGWHSGGEEEPIDISNKYQLGNEILTVSNKLLNYCWWIAYVNQWFSIDLEHHVHLQTKHKTKLSHKLLQNMKNFRYFYNNFSDIKFSCA